MRRKAARLSGITAVLGVGLHFISHGYIAIYDAAASQLIATKTAVIEGLAQDFGYERIAPIETYTAEMLAEKEALIAGVNPALIRAMMHVESRGKEFAESPVGAIGLMQVMPFNAKRCKLPHYSKLWTPEANVKCGVQIISEELRVYGDLIKALMAYNGGAKAVTHNYPACQKYARDVLNKMAKDIR